jgi:DNA-binding LacI/PurR family transcriptional regulator
METTRSKHSEVSRQLRAEIASGKFGVEGRLPSEAQLVKRFAVSRPTIGQALRSLEAEGLVTRRAGSGTYVRAGSERGQPIQGRLLALLIPDLGNTEIFQLICGEIASLARVHDYSLVWGGSGQARLDTIASLENARELCRHYIERRVSGVFFAPYELLPEQEFANREIAVMLRDAGIQVILVDRDITPFPRRNDFDVVGVDNIAAGWQLADHLLRLGCRRLQFVSRPLSAPSVQERIAGAREALVQHGVFCGDDFVSEGDPSDARFVRGLLVPNKPDAFICANDHTAALLMRSLSQLKLSVPRDVRVVGMDDMKFATLVSPALTTMQQPCREIAIAAFRAMMERLSDPTLPSRRITLASRLVVRDSCGAYLPRKAR